MTSNSSHPIRSIFLPALLLCAASVSAHADGTQMLGVPLDLAAPSGTRMIVAGVGVRDGQPQNLNIAIPAGATVRQVVAYWSAVDWDLAKLATTDDIRLNGATVVGKRIGDPSLLFNTGYNASYRSDVTAMHLLAPGNNAIAVDGVDFVWPAGAGLVAFVDDGGPSVQIETFDGNDVLSEIIAVPRVESSVVTYTFDAAPTDRSAKLAMFFSSFFPTTPTVITLSVDGTVQEILADAIGHDNGNAWDTVQKDVFIPAGATSLAVKLAIEDSGLGRFAGSYAAGKMAWIFSGLTIDAPPQLSDEGCSPGYWKCHPWRWNGCGGNDYTRRVQFYDSFNASFGVTPKQSGLPNCVSLYQVLWLGGGGTRALARQAVAALANADTDLNFPYSLDEVIALYRDGVGASQGPETWCTAKDKLEHANQLGCPLN